MLSQELLANFAGTRVVVTGGTGMIGRQVVRTMCDASASVVSVSLDRLVADPRAEHVYADLADFSRCKAVIEGADYVFHIAGIKGSVEVTKAYPASFLVPLLMMNTNVLEASRINGVKKVLYASSIGAYAAAEVFKESDDGDGPPMDLHPGWAKRMAELQISAYHDQYGLDNFAIVRPCNVYGPGDNFDPANAMVIPALMARVRGGESPLVVWGDGSPVRDFAYSEDVAGGMVLALWHGTRSRPINIASGVGYSIRELVETMREFIDFDYRFDASKPAGFPRRIMDITLARERLGYEPLVSLRDGLERTWTWLNESADETAQRKNYFTE